MSFQNLTPRQRQKTAKRSHFSIASRKLADTFPRIQSATSTSADDTRLTELRAKARTECFSPLSDGPIARIKIQGEPSSRDRESDRLATLIEHLEASAPCDEEL